MASLIRRRATVQSLGLSSPVALQFATPSSSVVDRTRLFTPSSVLGETSSPLSSYSNRYMRRPPSKASSSILFLCLLLTPWIRHVHTVVHLQSLQRQLAGIRSTTENWQQRRATAQRELETTRRRVVATQNENTVAVEQLQEGHMQLGYDNSDNNNNATTNNPSFLAAHDYEDALLGRLAKVEDEIPRASSRALKHAKLLFQTIRVEIELAHSAPLPNQQQHLVLTLASTTIVPHTVETLLRNLDFYEGWTLHVSPQHHRIEIVQSVRPGLYVSTTTVGLG